MRAHLHTLVLLALATLSAGASGTDMTNAPAVGITNAPAVAHGTNFEAFRLIGDRNIFNQNRSPRLARKSSSPARSAPKVHALSLVGTMSYARGDFAFFDGTSPEYKKPVKEGDKIAGYEIKEITPSRVKVANEKEEFDLKVGQQLRREDDGAWQIATAGQMTALPPSAASEGGAETKSPGGSISEEEALKRLMEKRAKEMNP